MENELCKSKTTIRDSLNRGDMENRYFPISTRISRGNAHMTKLISAIIHRSNTPEDEIN